jgi:hypothetical protein
MHFLFIFPSIKEVEHNLIEIPAIEEKIISIRNSQVILDFEVARLYGVETKHINQAVKNNPEKFPSGYVFELSEMEWGNCLRSNNLTANNLSKSRRKISFSRPVC